MVSKTKTPILLAGKSYTFSDYFELNFSTEELLAEFGYELKIEPLDLPKGRIEPLTHLQKAITRRLPRVPLRSETARREFYVSPLLLELLDRVDFRLDIEYTVNVSNRLKGTVDYLLRADHNLMVIEAKNADMERGFTQLAVEMIAVSEYLADIPEPIYGAITTGDLWRFGILKPSESVIYKDVNSFLIPQNLDELAAILAGVLS